MVGKLKAKRFRQIFEYLDQDAGGDLDLITLVKFYIFLFIQMF